ncbi:hypothetical protein PROH_05985 [Prochlorothrix hollandica PCC 9006 = CALU 1027]|uniref:Uncharacterized protein n=1 Tax=Prochlorothrix hollandica PCC 9006 = CALU 1027 TaxID=317619 RepID=A0A0M2Q2F3_PROHO|nr:hypothetical protein PROH_05985 [Prochlorothrix hollandica PCC 9006 = CALU 1027]
MARAEDGAKMAIVVLSPIKEGMTAFNIFDLNKQYVARHVRGLQEDATMSFGRALHEPTVCIV